MYSFVNGLLFGIAWGQMLDGGKQLVSDSRLVMHTRPFMVAILNQIRATILQHFHARTQAMGTQ